MHRSRWARSASIAILALARTARGGAHEKPRYSLENGKIVIEHDGFRDEMNPDCDEAISLSTTKGELRVVCSDVVLEYTLEAPLEPKLAETYEPPAPVFVRFESSAPPELIDRVACSLSPASTIGGRERPFDVRIGERRCSSQAQPPGAIILRVRVVGADESERVFLTATPPSAESTDDLRVALDEISRTLRSRLTVLRAAVEKYDAPPPKPSWYGWQTLIVDGSSALACLTIVLCPLGLAAYLAGPPIVHGMHGHPMRAWASVALRASLPAGGLLTGGLIGLAATCPEFRGCQADGALGGFLGGLITGAVLAPIVDALIARDESVPRVELLPTGIVARF